MKSIWVPISGQIAQQQKVETIANNIANANTDGFKKDDLVFKEYLTALENPSTDIDIPRKEFSPEDFYRTSGNENSKVIVDGKYTNFSQGELKPTDNPLDLGINGTGFFELNTPRGLRYSRKGSFTLDQDGYITNNQGDKLLMEGNGSPESRYIKVPANGKIDIAKDRNIYINQNVVGKISTIEFNDQNALKKEGDSLYINPEADNLSTNKTSSIYQGFIESSNVNAVSEISSLIQAQRTFESIQKAINAYDAINQRAVNDISRF